MSAILAPVASSGPQTFFSFAVSKKDLCNSVQHVHVQYMHMSMYMGMCMYMLQLQYNCTV